MSKIDSLRFQVEAVSFTPPLHHLLLQEFRRAGFEPTQTQLNYLMGAFSKAGRKAEALGFYEELLAAGLRPSTVTYGTLMDMARPDLPKVRAWFEQMKADGVEPDRLVLNPIFWEIELWRVVSSQNPQPSETICSASVTQ